MIILNTKRALSNLYLFTASFIWGTAFVAQRVGMDDVGPFTFCASRYFIGSVVIFIVAVLSDMRSGMSLAGAEMAAEWRSSLKGGLACGIALFLASSMQQVGMQYTGAGKAGFITTLYIVFVPIIGLLMGKRSGLLKWLAVVMSLCGLYLLSVKDGFTIELGDAILIVSSLFWSAHILSCNHFTKDGDPLKLSCIQFAVPCVMSLIAMSISESPTAESLRGAMWPIFYVGFISTGIAFTCQMAGQKYADPVNASLIMSLESIFAVLAGYFLLQETFTMREIVGCVLMFVAVVISQLPQKNEAYL